MDSKNLYSPGSPRYINISLIIALLIIPVMSFLLSCNSDNDLKGHVMSGDESIESTTVTLYSSGTGNGVQILGADETDQNGFFKIGFNTPSDPDAVLYLIAENDGNNSRNSSKRSATDSTRLALMLGTSPVKKDVVINERTTVAAAYAMAQFFTPGGIDGTYPGLQNAAAISHNLADPTDGGISTVLDNFPNGASTTTRGAFNNLSNMLAACVRSQSECYELFTLATPPGGTTPSDTLQAMVNIAHYPWQNVVDLLSFSGTELVYEPTLKENINSWTLALRYDGNGHELNGPGNIAFDKYGNAWICNNYVYQLDPVDPEGVVCGDTHVIKLTPTGEDAPGAPYEGGGLYGAGYGISLDPDGNVWVGNFGFQGTNCPLDSMELSRSVSKFAEDGTPLSPNSQGNEMGQDHGGFKGAGNTIDQPQGTVSDKEGNIWIANCNSKSVTQFPSGDPDSAFNIYPVDNMDNPLLYRPFSIAIDTSGNAWVSSNGNDSVLGFDPDGNLLHAFNGTEATDAGINFPMGVATDNLGNVWVANSGIIQPPCDGRDLPSLIDILFLTLDPGFTGANASVSMIGPDGSSIAGPFKGGGLLIPWGIAVDGNNNVWVANFQGKRVSEICGAQTENCPPGLETGDPISPDGGYSFNGLVRNTGVQIDPSGNVWLTNNWETIAVQENPGGKQVVVFIGLAKPVQGPLIGPPNS